VLIFNSVANERVLYAEFGERVRKYRRRLKLNQEDLGARVRLSRTSITNIEGGRQKILLHQLFALADALEVSPQALLPDVRSLVVRVPINGKLPKGLSEQEKEWIQRVVMVPTEHIKR
jgi:transcriptional regulator with XRE-family HTH domain